MLAAPHKGAALLSFRALGACLLVTSVNGACHSMAHVSPQNEPDPKPFEMRFTPARTIEALHADGTARSLPEVVKASGRLVGNQRDSVTVNISSWTRAGDNGEHREPGGLSATFAVADTGVSFHRRHFSSVKTLVLLGSIAGLIALSIGQASIATPGNIGNPYDVLHFLP